MLVIYKVDYAFYYYIIILLLNDIYGTITKY
jgi:hypothetical protein